MKSTLHSMPDSEPTSGDSTSDHPITGLDFLLQFVDMSMLLTALLSSFFAILAAGWIIARHNHKFLRHERWCKTADEFCTKLEEIIVDFYSGSHDERERDIINERYSAYVESFMSFVEKKEGLDPAALFKNISALDSGEYVVRNQEMKRALIDLAKVRYETTQSEGIMKSEVRTLKILCLVVVAILALVVLMVPEGALPRMGFVVPEWVLVKQPAGLAWDNPLQTLVDVMVVSVFHFSVAIAFFLGLNLFFNLDDEEESRWKWRLFFWCLLIIAGGIIWAWLFGQTQELVFYVTDLLSTYILKLPPEPCLACSTNAHP